MDAASHPGGSMARRRTLISVLVGVALLALAACGGTTRTPPETHHLKGTLTLHGTYGEDFLDLDDPDPSPGFVGRPDDWDPEGHYCVGHGGYTDVKAGLSASVKNESGTVIGIGTFGAGTIGAFDEQGNYTCVFHFVIRNVPKAAFYQIEAGDGHRGTLRYSYAQTQSNNWKPAFTLG